MHKLSSGASPHLHKIRVKQKRFLACACVCFQAGSGFPDPLRRPVARPRRAGTSLAKPEISADPFPERSERKTPPVFDSAAPAFDTKRRVIHFSAAACECGLSGPLGAS